MIGKFLIINFLRWQSTELIQNWQLTLSADIKPTMKRREAEIGVSLCFLAVVLPIMLLRDFTPSNELRYLSIADEALRNHTLFAFSNHGTPYADKPPLYLWIVMLCRYLTGSHRMWLLSLFSVIPALGIVQTMNGWTRCELGEGARATAQLMTLTAGLYFVAAVTLRMDMLMSLFIVLSLREFWIMQSRPDHPGRSRWLFPLFIFLAVFTKGPMGLLIPLCSTTVYLAVTGRIRQFFRYWGLATWGVLILLCGLWFVAVWQEGGSAYLNDLVFHQTIGRAVNSFHHKAPFYYYAVSVWYSLAPWSLLVVGLMVVVLIKKKWQSRLHLFFLVVAVSSFVLLSCFSAKLQIYFLPAVPFFVYSAVMAFPVAEKSLWARIALAIPAAAFTLATVALAIVIKSGLSYLGNSLIYAAAMILSITGLATLLIVSLMGVLHRMVRAIWIMAIGMLLSVFVAVWSLPKLNDHLGYGNLCREALSVASKLHVSSFSTWRLHRPDNIDVYLHHSVIVIPDDSVPHRCSRPFLLLTTNEQSCHFKGSKVESVGPNSIIVVGR